MTRFFLLLVAVWLITTGLACSDDNKGGDAARDGDEGESEGAESNSESDDDESNDNVEDNGNDESDSDVENDSDEERDTADADSGGDSEENDAREDTESPSDNETDDEQPDDETDEQPDDEPVDEPELILSGVDDYWREESLSVHDGGGNGDVRVDESTTYQTFDGFGGTFCEKGWDALQVIDASERERAMALLFDPHEGLRFIHGRIPIGANDYAMDRYTCNDEANDFAMEHFSIERDREMLIPFIRAALTHQPSLRLWASAWSPPPWMKDNNAFDGGNMRDDPQILEAYALYLALYVEAYQDEEDLTIEAVHVQNEPVYETRYPSCKWTENLLRDFVRDYMGPGFNDRGLSAEIWLGTMSNSRDISYVNTLMADQSAAQYIKGFGFQWDSVQFTAEAASRYPGVPIMQTEHKCGNEPWSATYDANQPGNDHDYAEFSWQYIRDYIQAGVNSYMAWNMVLDIEGKNLDPQRPWPQNAPLVVDRQSGTLRVTPAYYVFRHLANFVDVGATRIGLSGSLDDGVAFKNPDGTIVVVLHNSNRQASSLSLSVGNAVLDVEIPSRGWATVNYQP